MSDDTTNRVRHVAYRRRPADGFPAYGFDAPSGYRYKDPGSIPDFPAEWCLWLAGWSSVDDVTVSACQRWTAVPHEGAVYFIRDTWDLSVPALLAEARAEALGPFGVEP